MLLLAVYRQRFQLGLLSYRYYSCATAEHICGTAQKENGEIFETSPLFILKYVRTIYLLSGMDTCNL